MSSSSVLRLYLCSLAVALLATGCSTAEPVNGCTLAAANQREILRAQGYLHPKIPARILYLHYSGKKIGHTALVYRLDESWCAYDDGFGTRKLHLPKTTEFPPPLVAARAAFPFSSIDLAYWY